MFDSYSLIALGNVWLQTLQVSIKDKNRAAVLQKRALYLYGKVLSDDPRNIWATNGIGEYQVVALNREIHGIRITQR